MTTSRSTLIITAITLILVALIPAASALEVVYDEPITEYITMSKTGLITSPDAHSTQIEDRAKYITFKDITKAQDLKYLIIEINGDKGKWTDGKKIPEGWHNVTYRFGSTSSGFSPPDYPAVLYLDRKTDSSGQVSSTEFTIYFPEWNIGSRKGQQTISLNFWFDGPYIPRGGTIISDTNVIIHGYYDNPVSPFPIKVTEVGGIDWKHHLKVLEDSTTYYIDINGFIDGQHFTSEVVLKKGAEIYSQFENPGERLELSVPKSEIDILEIISPSGTRYVYPLFGEGPYYPLRTVTVTMTDIDGNKISGFEVRAVNAYTGKSYTVSTDSDVAYITLPMDRTAKVPNPQTGEYEEAPVGYYNFYGNKPGYRMVPDYAIRVNVLPQKYMPDIFCDIIVAPVSSSPDDPNNSPVSVYVISSQTGELLPNAQVIIKDTRTLPWTEVVNQILPSGQGTFYLANDPGFELTQYYITAIVPGYKDVYDGMFFRVTGPRSVVVHMEPIEGGPVEEDNAFLEFYVRNLDGNPVSNAMVSVAGQTRWTNAQGFTQFEVPKNAVYSYTVSKSGYVTIKGSATVGDGPRYTVNVVLGPEVTPTPPPGTDPGTSPVNVYVISSQTGALLADAQVIIKDTKTDPWTEVVNQTLPSGQGTFYLANDPGFDPSQYYITAIVPGYKDLYNGLFFRVTGPSNIVVHMEPIEGGPDDENNAFLEFYVRNLDDNPVSNAMVSVAGQTRWTNAQGFTQFEVPKNASYSYTVSKSGYATIEGTVTVGDGPRYTVNVVLGPKDIPTQPPGPGVPTQPTPPGGIPGDDGSEGFLSEAVRGIGKLFGVGFSTAKIILGMLLALSIGFATAKKLRGGAAEFGLGLLGGTMLGVLVGLLPVWVIVVLLLIVGMYIGYRYVGGGNNG